MWRPRCHEDEAVASRQDTHCTRTARARRPGRAAVRPAWPASASPFAATALGR
ncbi:Hypothetical protein CAP_2312 [Chondromyces apiculatus DSM 436]|uniref:Uncharacterized protein n=1 Tax=Chondromyces apiculatus DSM 436 TaxID=1192034 RepID=A0A017TB48_9BACT|nr:Hypothetical protein CAP_2312 [Chondromyces apiculatus DSM 436]